MTTSQTRRQAWPLRPAVLLVAVLASIVLTPATAGASTTLASTLDPAVSAASTSTESGDSEPEDSESGDSKSGDSESGDSKSGDSESGDSESADPVDPPLGQPGPSRSTTPAPPAETVQAAVPAAPASSVPAPVVGRWRVTVEPGEQTVPEGEAADFTVTYRPGSETNPGSTSTPESGAGAPVTIRWQSAPSPDGPWTDLDESGTDLHTTATPGMDGTLIRAEVSSNGESSSSTPAVLHVTPAPAPIPTIAPASPPANCALTESATGSADAGSQPDRAGGSAADRPAGEACPAQPGTATPAPAPAEPYYGTVADPVIELGRQQTAVGHNFVPGSLVKVTLDGVDLGTSQVAPDGTVTTRFDTSSLLAGSHTVVWTPMTP